MRTWMWRTRYHDDTSLFSTRIRDTGTWPVPLSMLSRRGARVQPKEGARAEKLEDGLMKASGGDGNQITRQK